MNSITALLPNEIIPFQFYLLNDKGVILQVNEKSIENSGFSENELLGSSISESLSFINNNGWIPFSNLVSSSKIFAFRSAQKDKNSKTKKVLGWAVLNPISSLGFISLYISEDIFGLSFSAQNRDITIMLEAVFNSIQDPIGIMSMDHEAQYYNIAALDLFDLKIDDAIGKKCLNLHGKGRTCVDCTVSLVAQTGNTISREEYYPVKDVWLDVRGYPMFGADGKIEKVIEHIRDITLRKKSELNTRLSYFVIDRAGEAILLIDALGYIVRVNDMVCNLWGVTRDEIIGKFIDFFDKTMTPKIWDKFFKTIKRFNPSIYETETYHKNGHLIPVEVSSNFLDFDNDEYIVSFVRDITERKKADNSLKQAMSEIQLLKDRLEAENIYLQDEIKLSHNFEEIITIDVHLKKILSNVEKVASTNSTVLITGETGTGKELIARAIHNISKRKDRPLVKVNCASLPATLIESELFGYEKGAFTGAFMQKIGRFELANKGTIFLDEIGELPLELQPKLLRVIQDGEFERLGNSKTLKVDVRIIAATNRNLLEEVKKGNFRSDLFYRLNVFPVHLPPLRDRKQDIPLLVNQFIIKFSARVGKEIKFVPHKTMRALVNYNWPGNIRELENVIERAMITSVDETIQIVDWLIGSGDSEVNNIQSLAENEKEYILKMLKLTNYRIRGENGAAKILQIKPTTLEARMIKLGIRRK